MTFQCDTFKIVGFFREKMSFLPDFSFTYEKVSFEPSKKKDDTNERPSPNYQGKYNKEYSRNSWITFVPVYLNRPLSIPLSLPPHQSIHTSINGRAQWPSGVGLDWRPDGPDWVQIPLPKTSLRNFGKSVYPALPVSFRGDTKSCRSLLSGVCTRGSKRSLTVGKCESCRGLHHS